MQVDTSREAVERLALRMEGIARQTTVYASLDRAHAGDAAATLRALLARAEAAEQSARSLSAKADAALREGEMLRRERDAIRRARDVLGGV